MGCIMQAGWTPEELDLVEVFTTHHPLPYNGLLRWIRASFEFMFFVHLGTE